MVIKGNRVTISFDQVADRTLIVFAILTTKRCGTIRVINTGVNNARHYVDIPFHENDWIFRFFKINRDEFMKTLFKFAWVGDWPETYYADDFIKLLKGIAYWDEY